LRKYAACNPPVPLEVSGGYIAALGGWRLIEIRLQIDLK
jgi:hypothetical protein